MPLTIVTSFLQTHCDAGLGLLKAAGVSDPVRSETEMEPRELTAKICSTYLKSRKDRLSTINPDRIGKAWQMQAANIIVANADLENWGWADPDILPMLDFWADFEPESQFALFYTEPGSIFVEGLPIQEEANTREVLELMFVRWREFNDCILRFYNQNPDRCLLINLDALASHPDRVRQALDVKLGLNIAESTSLPENSVGRAQAGIQSFFLRPYADDDNPTIELFDELEATADCRGIHGSNHPPDYFGLLADHFSTKQALAQAESSLMSLREETEVFESEQNKKNNALDEQLADALAQNTTLESSVEQLRFLLNATQEEMTEFKETLDAKNTENELIALQLDQVQDELERVHEENRQTVLAKNEEITLLKSKFDEERSQTTARIEELTARQQILENELEQARAGTANAESLTSENELLLLQLEQVQEELEYQFEQAQRDNRPVTVDETVYASADNHPVQDVQDLENFAGELRIDMRDFINGMNWHDPERDGRWAGPGLQSSIALPALLEKGRYRVTVAVIDAMNRAIFDNAELLLGDKSLPIKRRLRTNLSGAIARIKRTRARLNSNISPFPAELIADFSISDENTQQHEIYLKFPQPASPSDRGEHDARRLTARISEISITKL
ncbi:MAG: hypothetical protein AAGI92_02690 [Pseudomonadota bacterium]